MTSAQFLARIQKQQIAPAYLFAGTEAYERRRCREALIRAVVGEDRENGVTQHDLAESSLAEVVDDARSLSLFAPRRVILAAHAEAALPKSGPVEEDPEGGESPRAGRADLLAEYLKDPSPGVVLVFDCARYDLEGEDKKKLERVRKFYAAVTETVDLPRFSSDEARQEAERLARQAGLRIEPAAVEMLVESLAADVARIAVEVEKLSLYAARERQVTVEDIAALVPDARATTIFALVNALGRRDRAQSLAVLDTLTREGEYLPLALAFLSTQFRTALVAKEAGLRSPQQVLGHFSRLGVPMWPSRAQQVCQTLAKFSGEQLARAVQLIFEADKGLRSARPDDRIVLERFVLELTA